MESIFIYIQVCNNMMKKEAMNLSKEEDEKEFGGWKGKGEML